jgi:hypothetical protein
MSASQLCMQRLQQTAATHRQRRWGVLALPMLLTVSECVARLPLRPTAAGAWCPRRAMQVPERRGWRDLRLTLRVV